MTIFIDTSAFISIIDADDENHEKAKRFWEDIVKREEILITSNYVLLETFALIQNRFGMKATRSFQEDVVPILTIEWVNQSVHQLGITGMLVANRRELSLVDCVSFDIMRQLGIKAVFSFDKHFKEQGYECTPK